MNFCGVLAVYKPVGLISKDVSRKLLKDWGPVRLGHVGTLDPLARGLLPLLVGRATLLQDHFLTLPKVYLCEVRLGETTDTLDLDGQITETRPWAHVTRAQTEEALKRFLGLWEQEPPLYSAVKWKGRPLYDYARKKLGTSVPLSSLKRTVHVHEIELVTFDLPHLSFRVKCGKGLYVRGLAQSLAEALGTVGTVVGLERQEAAGLDLSHGEAWPCTPKLIPWSKLNLPQKNLTPNESSLLRMGKALPWPEEKSIPHPLLLKDGDEALGLGALDVKGHLFLKRSFML